MHSESQGGSFKCGQNFLLFREHEVENKKQTASFTNSGTILADLQDLKKITKSINIMNRIGHFNSLVSPSLWFCSPVAPSLIIPPLVSNSFFDCRFYFLFGLRTHQLQISNMKLNLEANSHMNLVFSGLWY